MSNNTNWNLEILKNGSDFSKVHNETLKVTEEFIKKWSKNEKWLSDVATLKEALDEFNLWAENHGTFEDEWLYYSMKQSLDQNDPEVKANYNKIYKEAVDLYNRIQFFTIKLSKVKESFQKECLKSDLLKDYKHFLESLFKSGKHVLSEKEENILNLKSKVSHSNWTLMVSALMSKEEREVLDDEGKKSVKNFSEILELLSNKDKKIRDTAADVFNEILIKHLDIAEHEINSVLENKQINDNLRGYKCADESRFISDDVDAETVDTLVSVVSKRFNIAKEFYKLKAEVLGLDKLEYHERNIEVSEIKKKYSFKEAYNIVDKTFENLDSDFSRIFKDLFNNNQVDVFPKKGKRGGAFTMANRKNQPSFILLNYTESLNDILTMAHEFGHVINFELSKIQNALNFDFPMCTAETASTFCEDFVLNELLKEADDKLRFSIQMMKLNSDISTIFRQIAFYNFETELHSSFREKGYLSSKEIGAIFTKHMKSYMGDYVIQSEGSENWWTYVSHFRSFFYVYSYAFGLLVSKSLQSMVKDDSKFINEVKVFFSAGNYRSPEELLKAINIDIKSKDFWNKGLDEVEILLNETKELYKKKLSNSKSM